MQYDSHFKGFRAGASSKADTGFACHLLSQLPLVIQNTKTITPKAQKWKTFFSPWQSWPDISS